MTSEPSQVRSGRRRGVPPGIALVAAYAVLTYIIPMIGNLYFVGRIEQTTKIAPLSGLAVASLVITFSLFWVLWRYAPRLPSLRMQGVVAAARRFGRYYIHKRLQFALVAITVSVAFASLGLNSYRYGSVGVLDGNPLILITAFIHIIILADFVLAIFSRERRRIGLLSREYVENLLLGASLLISANGTADIFLGLIAFSYALAPELFRRLVFVRRRWWGVGHIGSSAALLLTFLVAFVVARVAGETIKALAGNQHSFDLAHITATVAIVWERPVFSESWGFDPQLIERLSTYYYAFLYTVDRSWSELNAVSGWVLIEPLKTAFYRMDFFMGGVFHVDRPEVGAVSRANALQLYTIELQARQGASPGLIASFNYVFPLPFSLVACALFLRYIARMVSILVRRGRHESVSIAGTAILLVFLLGIFQSPFDMLRIIDETIVYWGILFIAYKVRSDDLRKGQSIDGNGRHLTERSKRNQAPHHFGGNGEAR